MTLLKVKHKRCKEVLIVKQLGLIIAEDRCELEPGHPGVHRCARGVWMTQDKLQSYIENEGRSL